MNSAEQYWVLADVALEIDGDTTWIAPLPDGPVIQLQGVASVLLDHFRVPSRVLEAVDACVSLFDDAPPDAHSQLEHQAEDFVSIGILAPAAAPRTTASH